MAPTKVPKKPLKSMEKPIEKPISKSKKMKKRNFSNFNNYIYKLLRIVSQDKVGISKKTMSIMNSFINDMLEKIAVEASRFVAHGKKSTMGSRDIQAAVKLLLPGELAKHANIEGIKALKLYHSSREREQQNT